MHPPIFAALSLAASAEQATNWWRGAKMWTLIQQALPVAMAVADREGQIIFRTQRAHELLCRRLEGFGRGRPTPKDVCCGRRKHC